MSDKFDLSIAIVSWNVQELLRQTLESVYRETKGITFEIFVVDNASRDGSAEMVQRLFPRAWLFANTDNLGFAKANNRALREARGRYIVLLNPDTEIRDNALQKMVSGWMRTLVPVLPDRSSSTPMAVYSPQRVTFPLFPH